MADFSGNADCKGEFIFGTSKPSPGADETDDGNGFGRLN